MFNFSFLDLSGTTKKEKRGKKQTFELPHTHTFFPACFFSKLTYTMCRTYIVYTCTSPLPSPFSPFLHKVLLSAWCWGAPGQKDPLSSSEGVRSDEELVLALNAKSITPSMSAPSTSSVSSATPNFGKVP